MAPHPAWEDVLAAVEQDVARSALLLVPDGLNLAPGRQHERTGVLQDQGPLLLPEPAEMPEVPTELHGRIVQLYDEIDRVADGLRAALQQVRNSQLESRPGDATPVVPPLNAAEARSLFLDRRV